MADKREIEEAFERGRKVGQREGLVFKGIPPIGSWLPRTQFRFKTSWFESFVAYERHVTSNLREVQRARWVERTNRQKESGLLRFAEDGQPEFEDVEEEIKAELREVRLAVDSELEEGHGRPCIVEAMRASPQRPTSVVEYRDLAAFVKEDGRRGVGGWPQQEDAGGADFGIYWRLENPFRRWETTSWRVSWLCGPNWMLYGDDEDLHGEEDDETKEIYALESLDLDNGEWGHGRVWLLGKLNKRAAVDRALDDLRVYAMRERNSLTAAAERIAAARRTENGRGGMRP